MKLDAFTLMIGFLFSNSLNWTPKQSFFFLFQLHTRACRYLCPPEPPTIETSFQLPDEAPEKVTKKKRKRKKERDRDRSKVDNKEEQGTTQGKPADDKPRKTPLHTQPVTGNLPVIQWH